MYPSNGDHAFASVHVGDPADLAAISVALPGASAQLNGSLVEVATPTNHCFAHAGQWIVQDRATGTLRVVDDTAFAGLMAKTLMKPQVFLG